MIVTGDHVFRAQVQERHDICASGLLEECGIAIGYAVRQRR
jgi:hypothetical protein